MWRKSLVLQVEHHFGSVESASFEQGARGVNSLPDNPPMLSRGTNDRNAALKLKIFYLENQKKSVSPKRRTVTTGQSIKKTAIDTQECHEANAEARRQLTFDGSLFDKLPPCYTTLSIAMESIIFSWIVNCIELLCFSEHGFHDKYEQEALFPHMFHNRHLHRANIFMSNPSMLFLRDTMCFHGTNGLVEENNFATKVAAVWNNTHQIKNGPPALFFISTPYSRDRTRSRNSWRLCHPMQALPGW